MSSTIAGNGEKSLVLASGRAHPELANDVARELGIDLLPMSSYYFANGEIYVRSRESVRGKDEFLMQSHPAPLNNCRTITGGAFVPDGGTWPNEFDDVYLFAEFGCDRLFALDDSGADPEVVLFGENEAAVHLKFGPDGNLYYAALNSGEVRRISPV